MASFEELADFKSHLHPNVKTFPRHYPGERKQSEMESK